MNEFKLHDILVRIDDALTYGGFTLTPIVEEREWSEESQYADMKSIRNSIKRFYVLFGRLPKVIFDDLMLENHYRLMEDQVRKELFSFLDDNQFLRIKFVNNRRGVSFILTQDIEPVEPPIKLGDGSVQHWKATPKTRFSTMAIPREEMESFEVLQQPPTMSDEDYKKYKQAATARNAVHLQMMINRMRMSVAELSLKPI
jgi:hypothetical protein